MFGLSTAKLVAYALAAGAILSLVAAAFFYVSSLKSEIKSLQEQMIVVTANNLTLSQNNDVLKSNLEVVVKANAQSKATIDALLIERSDAQKIINDLAAKKFADKKKIDTLNNQIDSMLKDPKNDGTLAPVLKETIRTIQESRDKQ